MAERRSAIRSLSHAITSLVRCLPASAILASITGLPLNAAAQSLRDLRAPDSPLVLKAVGSFYVGGRTVPQTADEIGLYSGGSLVVGQMYVQYMIPKGHPKPSVVMIHGATLTDLIVRGTTHRAIDGLDAHRLMKQRATTTIPVPDLPIHNGVDIQE